MHLMIDFETLDTRPTATVLSLGCVLFNETGIIDTRYFKFDLQDQFESGRTINVDTLAWWLKQNEEARRILEPSNKDIHVGRLYVLLINWLESHGVERSELKIWGNGASFDVPILEDLSKDYPPLFNFWNIWCFRTFDKLTQCRKLAKREGVHHNALDDAIYQTNCVLAYWQEKAG